MLFRLIFLALVTTLTVCPQTPESDLAKLAWFTGCWTTQRGAVTIEEHWSKPAAATLFGYSRTTRQDRLLEAEFMRLDITDGAVTYWARIGSQSGPTPFRATLITDSAATFENPTHDFPQRILYRRLSPDSLEASIDGKRNGAPRQILFPMKRVACQ